MQSQPLSADPQQDPAHMLRTWIEENEATLLQALRGFARRICVLQGLSLDETARDLLVEVTRIALERADRFDATRPPKAWLLGIANKVTTAWSRQAHVAQSRQHSSSVPDGEGEMGDLFERLSALAIPGADVDAVSNVFVEQLLAQAPDDDRLVLRLAIVEDWNMTSVGNALGLTAGAARVRLHRALGRLRSRFQVTDLLASPDNKEENN